MIFSQNYNGEKEKGTPILLAWAAKMVTFLLTELGSQGRFVRGIKMHSWGLLPLISKRCYGEDRKLENRRMEQRNS